MDITPLVKPGAQVIQSYGSGRFRIAGDVYEGPVIVFPDRTVSWTFSGPEPEIGDYAPLVAAAAGIDVVLIGGVNVKSAERTALRGQGLVIETMDTGAACRTWNVLLAEGRRVAAALLPV